MLFLFFFSTPKTETKWCHPWSLCKGPYHIHRQALLTLWYIRSCKPCLEPAKLELSAVRFPSVFLTQRSLNTARDLIQAFWQSCCFISDYNYVSQIMTSLLKWSSQSLRCYYPSPVQVQPVDISSWDRLTLPHLSLGTWSKGVFLVLVFGGERETCVWSVHLYVFSIYL